MAENDQSSPVSASLAEIPDEMSPEAIECLRLPSEATAFEDPEMNLEERLLREEWDSRRALPWWKRPSPWWCAYCLSYPGHLFIAVLAG